MSTIGPKDSTVSRIELVDLCAEYANENENPYRREFSIFQALRAVFNMALEPARLCIEYSNEEPDYRRESAIKDELWEIFKNAVRPAILEPPKVTKEKSDIVVTYPNGTGVHVTQIVLGRGSEKEVYFAFGLHNRVEYAAAFVEEDEVRAMMALQEKRGIAQIIKFHYDKFDRTGEYEYLMWMELYDTNLEKWLKSCDLNDIKVIVKDLVYAVIALEGEDPLGEWICHIDLKMDNVFLKLDKNRKRAVGGAFLGDFGGAAICKTVIESDEPDEELAKYEPPSGREGQRQRFVVNVFHPLKKHLTHSLKSKLTLTELCADDPKCQKVMEAMEKRHGHTLASPYMHWQD